MNAIYARSFTEVTGTSNPRWFVVKQEASVEKWIISPNLSHPSVKSFPGGKKNKNKKDHSDFLKNERFQCTQLWSFFLQSSSNAEWLTHLLLSAWLRSIKQDHEVLPGVTPTKRVCTYNNDISWGTHYVVTSQLPPTCEGHEEWHYPIKHRR